MASSIEIRLPLVDSVLTEVVCALDDRTRYEPRGRKALLRRLGLHSLDPALFARPKSGFELPFNRWLRGALGREIGDTLRDAQAIKATGLDPSAVGRLWSAFEAGSPGLYWTRIWALYAFVRWCHSHRVYAAAA
jgi:asparagine synthase (glutamine-hydrolysing)